MYTNMYVYNVVWWWLYTNLEQIGNLGNNQLIF